MVAALTLLADLHYGNTSGNKFNGSGVALLWNANDLLFTKNIKDDDWLAVWGQKGHVILNKPSWKQMHSSILIHLRY